MPDRAYTVTFQGARPGAQRKRIRFEPTGEDGMYRRITEEWIGCTWRETGRETVQEVAIEVQASGEVRV